MGVRNAFCALIESFAANPAVTPDTWAEDWGFRRLPEGFVVCDGAEPDALRAFLARSPVEVPQRLVDLWLEVDGFAGVWDVRYQVAGRDLSHSVALRLLPYVEAFGGQDSIATMVSRTGSDALLQWRVLDPERFELAAEHGYANPAEKDFEHFAALLDNCILLECFSVDNQYYTVLKLDAAPSEPQLYLAYEYGLYPLSLRLGEYLDAMFRVRGACWPWPLLYVDASEGSSALMYSVEDARARAAEVGPVLGASLR